MHQRIPPGRTWQGSAPALCSAHPGGEASPWLGFVGTPPPPSPRPTSELPGSVIRRRAFGQHCLRERARAPPSAPASASASLRRPRQAPFQGVCLSKVPGPARSTSVIRLMGCARVDASGFRLRAVYFPDGRSSRRAPERPLPAPGQLGQAWDYAAFTEETLSATYRF